MDKNDKLIPLSLDGKAKVLCKLEGSVWFQKILTKTDVHSMMNVPYWFVQEHGNKFQRSILLRTVSSKQSWTVTLSISIREVTQVRAVGGWKEFVSFHGLSEGDLLIFSLKEISKFEVHLCREKACNWREFHSQPSSRNLHDAKSSLKQAKQPGEHLGAQGRTEDEERSSGSFIRRKANLALKEQALFASYRGSSSNSIDLKLRSDLGKSGGGDSSDAHIAHDVEVVHSRHDLKPKCDTRVGRAERSVSRMKPKCDTAWVDPAEKIVSRMKEANPQQTFPSFRKPLQPSFFKKLTVTSLSKTGMRLKNGVLEIPTDFWKTFCKDIHSLVKLQGICEDSPMRTVTCARLRRTNQNWQIRLTNGWKDFALENNLKVNQVLQFTLAGDSFFVVRRFNF